MRAAQRVQKQGRNVINSPRKAWEGMNIVQNKKKGDKQRKNVQHTVFMQIQSS